MRFNQKGYTEIITVALILGIIGSLFITGVFIWKEIEKNNFSSKLSDVNKEIGGLWNTYENKEIGFTVRHPIDWSVEYDESFGGFYKIQSAEKTLWDSMAPDIPAYQFFIYPFADNVDSLNLDNTSLVAINGVDGVRGREGNIPYMTTVVLKKDSKGFKLSWVQAHTTEEIERILSTFKFVD